MSPPFAHLVHIAHPFSSSTNPVKSTQSIPNFTKEVGDFPAPIEPSITADFSLTHPPFSYAANPLPTSDTDTNTLSMPLSKRPDRKIIQIPKDPTAITPEQESQISEHPINLTMKKEHLHHATINATKFSSNHPTTLPVNNAIKMATLPSSATPPEMNHRAHNGVDNFLHIFKKSIITFSHHHKLSKKEHRTETSEISTTKKPRIQEHQSEYNYNNDSNNEVAATNSLKIPAKNAEDLHNEKRGTIIRTAFERALQGMSTIKIPTNFREEIVRAVDSIEEMMQNTNFPTPRKREDRKSDSDDDVTSSVESASQNLSTSLQAPIIDGEQAKLVTAKMDNDNHHGRNCKFFSECLFKSPEQVTQPPRTTIIHFSTTSEEPTRIFFPTSPEYVIPIFRNHIEAVIRNGTIVSLVTPPTSTNSRQPPSTMLATHNNENTSIHDDALNCPAPLDKICPMSEHGPTAQNAVNPNFNDDIFDNGLNIVNLSCKNTAIAGDGIQTKQMTEIFTKTELPEETKFPTPNSPPTPPFTDNIHADTTNKTTDMLTTTIPAQTQTKSTFRHPATKIYNATDIRNKNTTQFSVTLPHLLSRKPAALESCNPFYFLPITEKSHKLHPIIDSNNYKTSYAACNASRITQDLDTIRILTPSAGHRHNNVNAATENNCHVIRYDLEKQENPSQHNALAVRTRRMSPLPKSNSGNQPATPNLENPTNSSNIDQTGKETTAMPRESPISATPALLIDTSQQISTAQPPQIPLASPDALTSSPRTDFTYPPIEDLTRTLLKYAKTANLRKLSYPTDLLSRRRQFNAFMDNLRIICSISPWTRQVFDLWPNQISYSHPSIGTAIYNLIFTNISDPCQQLIIDCPPDARTAILTLRRHCAPLTQDHLECTRKAFYSIKQEHQEVATSYLDRIRTLTRDCYHAGIPNTDAELIRRAIHGGSNHHFYAASYQRFDADIRRAELHDEHLPSFAELESHLLNIDDSRGLTLSSQNQRNFNQHANSAHQPFSNDAFQDQDGTHDFTPCQQDAFSSSTMQPITATDYNWPPNQLEIHPNNMTSEHPRQNNYYNDRRSAAKQPQPFQHQNHSTRPHFRPTSSNNANQRRPPKYSSSSNAANIVCNECGQLGHYANRCITVNRSQNNNRGGPPNRNADIENAAHCNQRAYYITNSTPASQESHAFHHQAFLPSQHDNQEQEDNFNDALLTTFSLSPSRSTRHFT